MKENALLNYIGTLTPEQIEKLCNHLPQLKELVSEECNYTADNK